jgi:hypothetical protein
MAKYQCLVRIPPDALGFTIFEGEVYDFDDDQIEKLTKKGHLQDPENPKAHPHLNADPHFKELNGENAEDEEEAQDNLETFSHEQLLELAGESGISVLEDATDEDIIAAVRKHRAESKAKASAGPPRNAKDKAKAKGKAAKGK